jgi:hypothetical protein
MNNFWRKIIKVNWEGKRRIKLMIKEANYERKDIEREQMEFQEIMGLYGEEAYPQHDINQIGMMEIIFETWEDIGRSGLKFLKRI